MHTWTPDSLILLIDNYDSFTYNLYDYLLQLKVECKVVRNDELSVAEIAELNPAAIVISPGPKRPADAGICLELIQQLHQQVPILGICLGHQAIGEFFGASLQQMKHPLHGKTSAIKVIGNDPIFNQVESPLEVMHYHSLYLADLPEGLISLAETEEGICMALKHEQWPLYGLQFHPESILTPQGLQILKNWINHIKK